MDPRVAIALADGARLSCGADVGIGLTGVAGPDPQDGIAVGTWFCAVTGPGIQDLRSGSPADVAGRPLADNDDPPGSAVRTLVRSAAVRAALQMLTNIAEMDS